MPLIENSSYTPPVLFSNPHVQSIYPVLFRVNPGVRYRRERITTPDGDFLDLDWSFVGFKRLAILTHGLEGHSKHSYMLGMVKALNARGISALAWNLRGCSGDLNLKEHFYHGGVSHDLESVIEHVQSHFDEMYLMGFSLGGNITLKYLGERPEQINPKIKSAVVFSAPVDMQSCANRLHVRQNRIYFEKFMWSIQRKMHAKSARDALKIPVTLLKNVRSFKELDELFTAPLFGYESAEHLWSASSSIAHLGNIRVPTLLVSAEDDPILAPECYPVETARQSAHFHLEVPRYGGHVGFISFNLKGEYWSETRALEFILR